MKRFTPSNPSGEQSPPEPAELPMPPAKPLYQRLLSLALYGSAILGILLYRTEITGWLEQASTAAHKMAE